MANSNGDVKRAVQETVQSRAGDTGDQVGIQILSWLSRGTGLIPAWWSKNRDATLTRFWKESDHLSGAIYTLQAKMTSIPRKVVARDPANKSHVTEAQMWTDRLENASEFGEGYENFYAKWLEDLLTQDNGAFGEVIGPGDPSGPITGEAIGIAHLDSFRCQRTGSPIWPVIYEDIDGKRYKLHASRVIAVSQMPSARSEMFGVGFCAVSRAVNVAQNLIDILHYKQEKLGSRPWRAMMVTKGGLDPEDVRLAYQITENEMDAQQLSRFSRVVVVGSQTQPDAGIDLIELSGLPDGFDEEKATVLGMAVMALAFGVDARELFPAMTTGATRADALLAHLKQRGKAPGQIISVTERQVNHKVLPPYLQLTHDFQDDAEDRQAAEIRRIRSQKRMEDLNSHTTTVRIERELMVDKGEISRRQFERMELTDGRLEDGTSVEVLFYVKTGVVGEILGGMSVKNPLDTSEHTPEEMEPAIIESEAQMYERLARTQNLTQRWELAKVRSALQFLRERYGLPTDEPEADPLMKPKVERRMRAIDATTPRDNEQENPEDSLRPSSDDNQPKEMLALEALEEWRDEFPELHETAVSN